TIPAGFGKERRDVARGAVGLACKQSLAPVGRSGIETVRWRLGRGESELEKLQGRQFAGYQIRRPLNVGEAQPGRYRESICVVQARVVKTARPLHFQIGDERVPIGNRTPAGVGMEIDAG